MSIPRPGSEAILAFLEDDEFRAKLDDFDLQWLDFTADELRSYRDRPDKLYSYGPLSDIGRLLRSIRILAKGNLKDMAEGSGMSSAQLSKLEHEAGCPNPEEVRDLAKYIVQKLSPGATNA